MARVARRDSMRPLGRGLADLLMRQLPSSQASNRGLALSSKLATRVWRFSGLWVCQPLSLAASTSGGSSACGTADRQVCEFLHLQVCRLNSTARRGVDSNGGRSNIVPTLWNSWRKTAMITRMTVKIEPDLKKEIKAEAQRRSVEASI